MKNLLSFLPIAMIAILGCQKKVDTEVESERTKVNQTYEEYVRNLGGGGFLIQSMERPFTLVDKVSIELSYANYKSSERLSEVIRKFDESSTRLAMWMLILTIVMAILVSLQVWIMTI